MTIFVVDIDGTICNSIGRIKEIEDEIWNNDYFLALNDEGIVTAFDKNRKNAIKKAKICGVSSPKIVLSKNWKSSGYTSHIWTDEVMKNFLSEENIMSDKIVEGSEILFDLAEKCKAEIIFLTGRSDYAMGPTIRWLQEVFGCKDIELIMRPTNKKDGLTADCKEKMFIEHIYNNRPNETFIFFEDEEETVKRYSKYGLVLKSPECWKVIGK